MTSVLIAAFATMLLAVSVGRFAARRLAAIS
jgi:hypothetical protein